jgi:LPS-assembly protein
VFDDTSLFDWDKFSGYDRVEGGVRANVGLQYTVTGADNFYANVLFGQSYQVAGRNSFRQGDLANVGLDSGLDSRASDYVGRFQISPNSNFAFVSRGRFDQEDFSLNRFEAGIRANFNPYLPVSTSLTYARYEAQPAIGYPTRREGLLASARWDMTPNWFVTGSVLLDLDRYLVARQDAIQIAAPGAAISQNENTGYLAGMSLGLGYIDECTTFSVSYSITPREIALTSGEKEQNHTFAFSLELRSLGEVGYTQRLGGSDDE